MKAQETDVKSIPFRGGMNTAVEPASLRSGAYSWIQNFRGRYPGFVKRKGQTKQHSTADSTNKVLSLYQFSKAKQVEYHLFAQMSDNDVLEASSNPPAITNGAFGSEVFSGSANSIPASWAVVDDLLLFANGVDSHQIWSGNTSPVSKFIVYRGAAAIPIIPMLGEDYSDQVSDGLTTTAAVLDSLDTLANYDCIFVMTPVKAKSLTFTISLANGSAAVMQGKYWNGALTACGTFADGTANGGASLATTGGAMSWVPAADEIPHNMFGASGFWYQLSLSSGALDSEVEITQVTYEAAWQPVVNVWDGVLLDVIEAQVYDASEGTYRTYGGSSITLDSFVGANDILYVATADEAEAFYIDVGGTPNTTGSTTISSISRWDGNAWQTIAALVDGTAGASRSGWAWLGRAQNFQQAFNGTEYYAHWYKIVLDKTFNDNVNVGISYRPYFDISELGKGQCVESWKDRACYSFDRWGQYIYVAAKDAPTVLNGDDYGILEAGDGRANKIVAMRKFYNELMVWQQEIGKEGGCLTLFEGYSPTTFGKLLLSSRLGAMNSKCVEIVDGVMTSTATEETIKTLAFTLSRFGVYVCDGRTCSFISDEIRNYFDPTNSSCIRRGYESEMWLKYDSAYNVIRIGLVTGASATVPNTFLAFDLKDKAWSADTLGQALSCACEVSAASGNVPVLQVGGGTADGTVYLLNYGDNDVDTAIDSHAILELDGRGEIFQVREMILRVKAQTGDLTLTPSKNGIAETALTLSMAAEITNQVNRRHRVPLNLVSNHVSLKLQNATASRGLYLEDFGLRIYSYGNQ